MERSESIELWHEGTTVANEASVSKDVNVLALAKGDERFIFLYTDANKSETLRTLGRFAADPNLNFSWYDAAVLSQRLRQEQPDQRHRLDQPVTDSGNAWEE
jgi:hypothetical protein